MIKSPTIATPGAAIARPDAMPSGTLSPAPDGRILIVSRIAGFRRANIVHPLRAEYPLDYFTQRQITMLRAEPHLEFIEIGGRAVPRDGVDGPGHPFQNAGGRTLRTDADLTERVHEAAVAVAVGAADADIKVGAVRDLAGERAY